MNPMKKMDLIMKEKLIINPIKTLYKSLNRSVFSTYFFEYLFKNYYNFLKKSENLNSKFLNCLSSNFRGKFKQEAFTGVFSLPHPAKLYKGGEDSFLIQSG
jgi:hypothetical protein